MQDTQNFWTLPSYVADVLTLTLTDLEHIELRYQRARAASDISALAILAVEVFPALIATAKARHRRHD